MTRKQSRVSARRRRSHRSRRVSRQSSRRRPRRRLQRHTRYRGVAYSDILHNRQPSETDDLRTYKLVQTFTKTNDGFPQDADLDSIETSDGYNLLLLSAVHGNRSACAFLVNNYITEGTAGRWITDKNFNGLNVLHWAIAYKDMKLFEAIMNTTAGKTLIDSRRSLIKSDGSHDQSTALMFAVAQTEWDMVNTLLEQGADRQARNGIFEAYDYFPGDLTEFSEECRMQILGLSQPPTRPASPLSDG